MGDKKVGLGRNKGQVLQPELLSRASRQPFKERIRVHLEDSGESSKVLSLLLGSISQNLAIPGGRSSIWDVRLGLKRHS